MENNKMTELELKIDKWLENEQFVAFANERMNNVLLNKLDRGLLCARQG